MIKVLITDKLAKEGIDLLNSIDGVEAVVKIGVSEDELSKIIGEHDGLIVRSGTKVTAKASPTPVSSKVSQGLVSALTTSTYPRRPERASSL